MLVINDHFTKFIKLYPFKDRTAPTTAKCIVDFCLTFGILYRLHSDMDPAFEAQLFQEIMKGLGVHNVRTCGYRPNANGLTEQSNNTIKQYLTKHIEENSQKQQNWDQWTSEVTHITVPFIVLQDFPLLNSCSVGNSVYRWIYTWLYTYYMVRS